MYSSDDETAKYSRGGEFLENLMSNNPLEFCRRWMKLGDVYQVIDDIKEFYKFNGYSGKPIDYSPKDAVYFIKNKEINAVEFIDDHYMLPSPVIFYNSLDKNTKEELLKAIEKEALL